MFIEAALSDRVAYRFRAVPTYFTSRTKLENRKEYRNINWDDAERRYSGNYEKFTPADFDEILNFFHVCYGAGYGFRFRDWTDYMVVNGKQPTVTGGTSTPIQLQKVYAANGYENVRPIYKPDGTVVIYQNVGAGPVAKAGTVDATTGLWTPSSAWGTGPVTGSFMFHTPVIFDNDSLPSTYSEFEALDVEIELLESDPFV